MADRRRPGLRAKFLIVAAVIAVAALLGTVLTGGSLL
jgi:hypothetical protein